MRQETLLPEQHDSRSHVEKIKCVSDFKNVLTPQDQNIPQCSVLRKKQGVTWQLWKSLMRQHR